MNSLTVIGPEAKILLVNSRMMVLFTISLIIFLLCYYIARRPKTNKKRKSSEGLISPILAEVLVDGKIDVRNLIMSTIVELQIKGNIDVIDDETIRLVHSSDLTLHEHLLINAIFDNDFVCKIKDINSRINLYSKKTNQLFFDELKSISDMIFSDLYKLNILSRTRMLLLNILCYIAMLILIVTPTVIIKGESTYSSSCMLSAFFGGLASWIYWSRLFKGSFFERFFTETVKYSKHIVIYVLGIVSVILLMQIPMSFLNIKMFILLLLTYFISALTLNMVKSNVLSEKGISERIKLLEFKNFLINYNLTKSSGNEYYIEWDKNFAYSVAFGISNPVTTKIYESWEDLDMTISFSENLI